MKLNSGWAVFEAWAELATDPDEVLAVMEAMLSLTDDTWANNYVHYDDVTSNGGRIIVQVHPNLWIVAAQLADYREYFNVVYIGPPDDE